MTALDRLLADYLDHLTASVGASGHTIAAYRRDLNRYREYLDGSGITAIREVTPAQVAGFAAYMREGSATHRPLAAASVARAVAAVRSFHVFAMDEGIARDNPAGRVAPPKLGRPLPKALALDQIQALLAAPDLTTLWGLRDQALLELLYGTGARVSEIVNLDVDEVSTVVDDPDAGLRLFGKGRKERLVPLGSFARKAVAAWLVRGRPEAIRRGKRPGPGLLLNTRGNRLTRQSAFAIVREHADRAGIPGEVSPHTLRHSFATHLLDGGADVRVVQELLGHASVSTTQIYTLVTAEHLREVFLAAHPRAH
ncbi:MAG: site-specific tyrosine recombinase XerD [Propioniciclava sp.]